MNWDRIMFRVRNMFENGHGYVFEDRNRNTDWHWFADGHWFGHGNVLGYGDDLFDCFVDGHFDRNVHRMWDGHRFGDGNNFGHVNNFGNGNMFGDVNSLVNDLDYGRIPRIGIGKTNTGQCQTQQRQQAAHGGGVESGEMLRINPQV